MINSLCILNIIFLPLKFMVKDQIHNRLKGQNQYANDHLICVHNNIPLILARVIVPIKWVIERDAGYRDSVDVKNIGWNGNGLLYSN